MILLVSASKYSYMFVCYLFGHDKNNSFVVMCIMSLNSHGKISNFAMR